MRRISLGFLLKENVFLFRFEASFLRHSVPWVLCKTLKMIETQNSYVSCFKILNFFLVAYLNVWSCFCTITFRLRYDDSWPSLIDFFSAAAWANSRSLWLNVIPRYVENSFRRFSLENWAQTVFRKYLRKILRLRWWCKYFKGYM